VLVRRGQKTEAPTRWPTPRVTLPVGVPTIIGLTQSEHRVAVHGTGGACRQENDREPDRAP
jgi:hypothetical protein